MLGVTESVLLQTAVGHVANPDTNQITSSRILLDSGSQRSYITEDLKKKLNLNTLSTADILLYTFGSSKSKQLRTSLVELDLLLNNDTELRLTFSVLNSSGSSFSE